jgi:hypothetical protein
MTQKRENSMKKFAENIDRFSLCRRKGKNAIYFARSIPIISVVETQSTSQKESSKIDRNRIDKPYQAQFLHKKTNRTEKQEKDGFLLLIFCLQKFFRFLDSTLSKFSDRFFRTFHRNLPFHCLNLTISDKYSKITFNLHLFCS